MAKYRKKPVVIEAIQWDGNNEKEIENFSGCIVSRLTEMKKNQSVEIDYLQCKTLEGVMLASLGDFIIKGVQGEFYPCKPDIFEQTYERVEDGDI